MKITFSFSFFEKENFNLWHPFLIKAFYYQTKTPTGFLCKWELNHRSLIQPLKTLSVELTRTHKITFSFFFKEKNNFFSSFSYWCKNFFIWENSIYYIMDHTNRSKTRKSNANIIVVHYNSNVKAKSSILFVLSLK